MSVCPEGRLIFKDEKQPIYVGNKRIAAIFVGEECVYPADTFQEFSFWVNLENERCATFGNVPIDKAGMMIYTFGPAIITKCAVGIWKDFMTMTDGAGNEGKCDGISIGIRCRAAEYARMAAFGSYQGKAVYDYKTKDTIGLTSFYRADGGSYTGGRIGVYNIFLGKNRAIHFDEGVETSGGMKVFYDAQAFYDYITVA